MQDYTALDSVLEQFLEQLGETAATPSADHLFMVRYEGKYSTYKRIRHRISMTR